MICNRFQVKLFSILSRPRIRTCETNRNQSYLHIGCNRVGWLRLPPINYTITAKEQKFFRQKEYWLPALRWREFYYHDIHVFLQVALRETGVVRQTIKKLNRYNLTLSCLLMLIHEKRERKVFLRKNKQSFVIFGTFIIISLRLFGKIEFRTDLESSTREMDKNMMENPQNPVNHHQNTWKVEKSDTNFIFPAI